MSEGYSWMSGLFESLTGKLLKALSDLCCLDKLFKQMFLKLKLMLKTMSFTMSIHFLYWYLFY